MRPRCWKPDQKMGTRPQLSAIFVRMWYDVIHQCLPHYHTERHHQGRDQRLTAPEGASGCPKGHVGRRDRLGSLLRYDHREAA
jgi:hypothetical protein